MNRSRPAHCFGWASPVIREMLYAKTEVIHVVLTHSVDAGACGGRFGWYRMPPGVGGTVRDVLAAAIQLCAEAGLQPA